MNLSCYVLQIYCIMFVTSYYLNYSGDQGPQILSYRATCWPTLLQALIFPVLDICLIYRSLLRTVLFKNSFFMKHPETLGRRVFALKTSHKSKKKSVELPVVRVVLTGYDLFLPYSSNSVFTNHPTTPH